MTHSPHLLSLAVFGCLALSSSLLAQQPVFSDQTQAAGLSFTHKPATDHPGGIMHAGGAVGDFNRDGWPDLFVIGGGGEQDRLFLNNQDGTFTDHAASWNLDTPHRGIGACAGDFNNDGWVDLFVSSAGPVTGAHGPGHHRLYRNNGNGTFTDIATQAGVNLTAPAHPDGWGSAFGDYDLDGDLDLFVAGWFHLSGGNRLFRNNGDETFTDVTVAAGVDNIRTHGFSPRFVDMNHDRYPELLVAADFRGSRYYINQKDGTFVDGTDDSQTSREHNGMGNTVGDFNNDGRVDWYVSSIYKDSKKPHRNGNRLYLNQGEHFYVDLPESAGVNNGGWGWGTVAIDVNHDGWLDIVETNGWEDGEWHQEQSYLFLNRGNDTFAETAFAAGIDNVGAGRGLIDFDYDRDGDMDVVFFSYREPLELFRNDLPPAADTHWLRVVLDANGVPGVAPDGLGARVKIWFNGESRDEWVEAGSNYLATSEPGAHFGLGTETTIDHLRVFWPDGSITTRDQLAADQILTLKAGPQVEVGPLQRGQTAACQVSGVRPGEWVRMLYSRRGVGSGPCVPKLGGLCLDLVAPVHEMGRVRAGNGGIASLPVTVPVTAPLGSLHLQAVVQRGNGGLQSVKSEVVSTTIQP